MNDARRKLLYKAIDALDLSESYINEALEQEQDSFDNIPESFEGSDRYNKMEETIDNLENVIDSITEIKSIIDDVLY